MPFELTKQQLQAGVATSATSALRATYATHGLRAFWQAYTATVAREVPFSLIQFPLYELLRRTVRNHLGRTHDTPAASALCGSAAGVVAAALTNPIDVVKTRICVRPVRLLV